MYGPRSEWLSDPVACECVLRAAGFGDVHSTVVEHTWVLDDGDQLFSAFLAATSRTGTLLRRLDRSVLATLRRTIISRARAEFSRDDDRIAIPMAAIVASGTRV